MIWTKNLSVGIYSCNGIKKCDWMNKDRVQTYINGKRLNRFHSGFERMIIMLYLRLLNFDKMVKNYHITWTKDLSLDLSIHITL